MRKPLDKTTRFTLLFLIWITLIVVYAVLDYAFSESKGAFFTLARFIAPTIIATALVAYMLISYGIINTKIKPLREASSIKTVLLTITMSFLGIVLLFGIAVSFIGTDVLSIMLESSLVSAFVVMTAFTIYGFAEKRRKLNQEPFSNVEIALTSIGIAVIHFVLYGLAFYFFNKEAFYPLLALTLSIISAGIVALLSIVFIKIASKERLKKSL